MPLVHCSSSQRCVHGQHDQRGSEGLTKATWGIGAISGWFQGAEIRDCLSQDNNPSRKYFTVSETRSLELGEIGEALPSPVRLRQDVPCLALKENKTQLHELFFAPAWAPSISVYKMASYSGKTWLERPGLQTEHLLFSAVCEQSWSCLSTLCLHSVGSSIHQSRPEHGGAEEINSQTA